VSWLTVFLLFPPRRNGKVTMNGDVVEMPDAEKIAQSNSGAANFVRSEMFARTFREGMTLVEETANYLDGEGREASKMLSRSGALAYAGASMRLTTLLMQIASWLLVLRAVREGDMAVGEAGDSKYRLPAKDRMAIDLLDGELPNRLLLLIDEAGQLYDRIARLDSELFTDTRSATSDRDAAAQQRALFEAFGLKRG
jgi:regulator of CtrA degradation